MTIYERIKSRRIELNMTQEELAIKVGYKSRSSINKIELGLNDISQSQIVAFANALNTTPAYLMGWESAEISNSQQYTELTPHEQTVITQYRAKPHLQEAVDKLLDVPPEPRPLDEVSKDISRELSQITGTAAKKPTSK